MDKKRFIQGCAQGGRALDEVIVELHRLHWSDLVREARRVLGALESARDAAQLALIKGWRDCKSFRGEAEVWAWLRPIVQRTAIDVLRRQRVEVSWVDEANDVLPEVEAALRAASTVVDANPMAVAETAECRRLFRACYARFESDHPESAFALRCLVEDELDNDALAERLGRTPHATREFVSQSRKKARVYLAPWYALVCRPSTDNAAKPPIPEGGALTPSRLAPGPFGAQGIP